MKNYFAFFWLAMLCLVSCNPQVEVAPKYPLKALLHEKTWKVVSIQAERKSDGEVIDWYSQLPACVKDNIFFTEAPGTGAVGELHAEEGSTLCQENDLSYIPHIAGWKLNDDYSIFSVSLFYTGHHMLYGYELEESYTFENWMVDDLNEEFMQIKVDKVFEEQAYAFTIRFEVVS
ncbi:hypothetical protein [Catalinimonas niigatensis]|uniref:hypothetical protein n=1 Tax=Catalinimonas niigatensis TaxID=1397264 RepID=UPI002666105A|nr:hypothetical protein [Catalinimonas niigatensis]WPP51848.1 hypothetical protein PZB72_05535 [Catalinimonas niigatensis]